MCGRGFQLEAERATHFEAERGIESAGLVVSEFFVDADELLVYRVPMTL